jgi:hypothetical protein
MKPKMSYAEIAALAFEQASRAQLDREMSLLKQQAAKRARDAAAAAVSPDRVLHRKQLAAGTYEPPWRVAERAREAAAAILLAAGRREALGPECVNGPDPWDKPR